MKRCLLMLILLLLIISGCQMYEGMPDGLDGTGSSNENSSLNEAGSNGGETETIDIERGEANKADYLETAKLISQNYIYLEKKLNMDRTTFYKDVVAYADQTTWTGDKVQLVRELKSLMSRFEDGHVSWFLPEDYRISKTMTLGFVATATNDGAVVMDHVYPMIEDKLSKGDIILKWNEEPIENEVGRLVKLSPSSSAKASEDKAVRMLGIDYSFMPLREDFSPVKLWVKKQDGSESEVELAWKNCSGYTVYGEVAGTADMPSIFMTPSLIPSTEEIPEDAKYISPSLIYYNRQVGDKAVAVLHPRDFYRWSQDDLDQTMEKILADSPTVIFVDLKDTAGGSFDEVLYLSHALSVTRPFTFQYDVIDSETHERSQGKDGFDNIEKDIDIQNRWDGKVIIRINSIVQSGGDYFARWMQLNNKNNRFLFIGAPTTGAGGGTDTFTLSRSKIEISFPLRDRVIEGDDSPIEGNPVLPDVFTDETVDAFVQSEVFLDFCEHIH